MVDGVGLAEAEAEALWLRLRLPDSVAVTAALTVRVGDRVVVALWLQLWDGEAEGDAVGGRLGVEEWLPLWLTVDEEERLRVGDGERENDGLPEGEMLGCMAPSTDCGARCELTAKPCWEDTPGIIEQLPNQISHRNEDGFDGPICTNMTPRACKKPQCGVHHLSLAHLHLCTKEGGHGRGLGPGPRGSWGPRHRH